ncbi:MULTISPECIES: FAD-dependent oxidoreductase [Streptomyces]|uniref:2,4-dichlorophenol 6-monooxygenase n=1 Tax=Streptomyces dengpaensis TaxID=2049881 RepID=A0ABM6SRX2_9ACTN|nr:MULTISPECIES: FAD-dependent monooxygenase [Streptomyces]AVH57217.1 2,4-dichlorophenol 6-monooxygenase [Streptomyces dengpaensis]PIB08880.1 2,4-dichlorophenol 6-monooxygenase [Streptomyces sp. HG99]
MTHTHPTGPGTYDTDVLVVGSGPAGGSAALLLATYGIRTLLVTKYGWLANTPRAHITNQRTMEVLRDLDVEAEALAVGSPSHLMGDTVLCTALAGEEIGRIRSWGTGPASRTEYASKSPCEMIDLPQTYLEPILVSKAAARGAKVRFDTEFLSFTQDEEGVTALLRDRVRGDEFTVRARYLIGADGANSLVAEQLALPFDGRMAKAGSMNIVFKADLARHCAHRPSVLYWVLQPGAETGGIGMGLVRMVRPWNEWLLVWGYDIEQPPPEMNEEEARRIVRDLIGDPELPVEITSTSLWTVNHSYASAFSSGRVFCAGDAVHRHPPSNGLGSNTSVQDAYNLAWKLAMVIRGEAGPALLDSYSAERAPVGRQIVERANLSRDQFGPIFDVLGVGGGSDEGTIAEGLAAVRSQTAEGAKRRRLLEEAIQLKNYEFNAHGVEMNQRYVSGAVLADGTSAEAEVWEEDRELSARPTTRPGAKLPHAWLVDTRGERISTLDVVGKGVFTVLTGLSGGVWDTAADACRDELGIPLRFVRIGDADFRDAYGEWSRASEITEDGVLLVRPDGHVAWRRTTAPQTAAEARQELLGTLRQVLGRQE